MTEAKAQSPSTTKLAKDLASTASMKAWTGAQAYLLAAFCLLLGVALGYLFRGSASPAAQTAASAPAAARQESAAPSQPPDPAAQAALAQAAAPLLEAVNKDPKDFDSLVKLGNLYYDGQQFPNAIQYYERALAIHPDNPDVRTDMGTAYWYTGNAEKALAAMETSLKYRPGHPQTLFNLGWVRWQGKQDPKGAIEAWQQLLQANPDYPQRQQVEQYISKAKEHASRG
ncbi:MAG TPA: tetratricopeptide repeat protein [Candidatus Sulfotelmatobacter sp.]|jgi:cytochrome c-type biogenesis protein CcmH/NrfG|nr:tetratricopeptide repeat protein [Candidatus Sulfotelmatobacter sp.]